jgi:hypothetical protein
LPERLFERLNDIQEVDGSIPPGSTKFILIATMTCKRPSFRRLSTVRLQVATWSPPRTETWGNVIQHSDGGGMLGMVKQDAAGLHDMCGCPLRSKRNLQERCGPWSGADMCAAFDAAHTPQARMGVRGSGPIQAHALDPLVVKLVFQIPSLDRCAIPLL